MTAKQKSEARELLAYLKENSLDTFLNEYQEKWTKNRYAKKLYDTIDYINKNNLLDKDDFFKYYKDVLAIMLSPINSHNFVSPDPY